MSKIDELIREYCPKGVEYKTLEELGSLYGGLTGKSKDDFKEGNARFITYMNIYSNIAVDTSRDDFVKIKSDERQRKLVKGDVLFTGSSENPDECGMSSVVIEEPTEPLYLNSFCFIFRLNDTDIFLPDFLKYLFRDTGIRKQIAKTASGVTRFNVSKKRFSKVIIPIPPLEVQKEIMNILDKFTQLESEMSAELAIERNARQSQYEYYRERLLVHNQNGQKVALSTLCKIGDGLHGTPKYNQSGDYYFINGNNLKFGELVFIGKTKKVDKATYIKHCINLTPQETILMSINGTVGSVAMYRGESVVLGKSVAYFNVNTEELNPRYLYHLLQTNYAKAYFESSKTGSTIKNLGLQALRNFAVSLPEMSKQIEIVSLLDKYEMLSNGLAEVLPVEMNARRQQYEYYRTKLLTFQELTA